VVFTGPIFLFGFLPFFLLLYALAPACLLNPLTLVASLVFYGWGEPSSCSSRLSRRCWTSPSSG
jgi:alginate O-acetyltransferase complex protein AlgI